MLAKARHDSHYLTQKVYFNDCSSITVNGETLAKTAQYYSIEELGVAMVSVDLEQIRSYRSMGTLNGARFPRLEQDCAISHLPPLHFEEEILLSP